ncbi:MAG: imidazole glycerol phosphate synthase subunit HisH [Elusimicrobia bacterium]|nr:MAG: imidazole glycerol phosphate synthase subunit HisH [Elusimicrobiota bacterium]
MIAIVDTGGANIGSVVDAFSRLGVDSKLTADPNLIQEAKGVVLPGVGAAADSMARIQDQGLVEILQKLSQPVLGICLGMQLLFERSEEGDVTCLGLLPGKVRRLPAEKGARIPHMGWNRVQCGDQDPLFAGIKNGAWFYFVHSYAAPKGDFTVAEVEHGNRFPAVVAKGSVYGVQFHPERSGTSGAALLKNFVGMTGCN